MPTHTQWAVMTCGHCLCTECCDQLLQHHRYPHHYGRAGRIQCPLCREMCHADEIGAVSTTTTSSSETEELKIEVIILILGPVDYLYVYILYGW